MEVLDNVGLTRAELAAAVGLRIGMSVSRAQWDEIRLTSIACPLKDNMDLNGRPDSTGVADD